MWGGIIGLIIQLISGAVGGNIAGAAMEQYGKARIARPLEGAQPVRLLGAPARCVAPNPRKFRWPLPSRGRSSGSPGAVARRMSAPPSAP